MLTRDQKIDEMLKHMCDVFDKMTDEEVDFQYNFTVNVLSGLGLNNYTPSYVKDMKKDDEICKRCGKNKDAGKKCWWCGC